MNKTSREGNRPATGQTLDPALEDLCRRTPFPLKHQALTDLARDQNIEPDLLARIETMPLRTYNTLEEFRQAFIEDLENYGGVHEQHRAPPPTS